MRKRIAPNHQRLSPLATSGRGTWNQRSILDRIDRIIEMPVKKVTSVVFGGPRPDILFVTSMAKPPLPRFPGDGALRGSLFAIYDLGITGLPEPRFGA